MKNELNKNIDCLITKSIIVKKILAFHQHMNTYKPKFWRWFAVVCGGLAVFLTAHGHTDVLSSQILVVVCGGLRWCVVVCGGLWWFAVVCGGLWWIAVVCLLVILIPVGECCFGYNLSSLFRIAGELHCTSLDHKSIISFRYAHKTSLLRWQDITYVAEKEGNSHTLFGDFHLFVLPRCAA